MTYVGEEGDNGELDDADSGWSPPPRIGELLDRVVRGLGSPGADVIDQVFGHWAEVAGPLADYASPVMIRDGALIVVVDQPVTATEVRYRQHEVLDRLDDRVGAGRVTRIEVQIRPRG
jgi:predicted nucleic acid-binding Zn ribbon protein